MKRLRYLFIIIVIIILTLILPGTSISGEGKDKNIIKMIEIINLKRASGGKCGNKLFSPSRPLRWDSRLAQAALIHAKDIASREILSHMGRDGSGSGERISSTGYKWKAYAENIGEGYMTAEDMLMAWLNSEGHCKNVMNPAFKDVGAARIVNKGRTYWVLVLGTIY